MSSSSSPTLLTALSPHLCQNPVKFATLDFEFTDCLHLDLAIEALFCPYKCCTTYSCSVPFLLPLSLFIARLGTLITSESLLRSFVGDQMMRRTGPDGYFVSFLSSSGESLPLVPHLCSCAMLARAKTPVKTVAHFNLMLITFSTLFVIWHMCFYRTQSTTNINKHSRQNS